MDWLSNLTGTITGITGGIVNAAHDVQTAVQAVQGGGSSSTPAPTSSIAPVGITYGPYIGSGVSVDNQTLLVLAAVGLGLYLLR